MKQNQASFLVRYSLQSFAIILGLGVLLRTFLVSSFVMSGMSMLPSVWPGDFILAAKWGTNHPKRGEVISLRCPHDKDQICLKRVVGLPGDRVEFLGQVLTINGEKASQKSITDQVISESVAGAGWLTWPAAVGTGDAVGPEPLVIPPHHLYVLNDKRDALEDSRTWGPIRADLIDGRAIKVWLSLDWFDGKEVRTWPRIRWERMFRSIN